MKLWLTLGYWLTKKAIFIAASRRGRCRSGRDGHFVDQHLRLADVAAAGRAEDDGLDARLAAHVLDRLARGERARGQHRHRDRAEAARGDGLLVGLDAAAHAKADLVDVGAHD